MNKNEFINLLGNRLNPRNYKFKVISINQEISHAEVLVINQFKHGVGYYNICFESSKLSVFHGCILNLPTEFIRVYNILED